MAKNLTQEEKNLIKKEYLYGLSYAKIKEKYGYSSSTISKVVKGMSSHKDRCQLSHDNGNYILTEIGRKTLSDNGKKKCQTSSKMWTKPEQEFRKILNEIGIGVKFPEEIKNIFKLTDDNNPIVYFQYPIQRYICDFVYPEKKIVFRIQGDFWHSNPILYQDDNLTKIQKHNKIRDKNNKLYLTKQGWEVIDIWESDIYWRKDNVIKQAIGAVGSTFALHAKGLQFDSEIAYSDEEWSKRLKNIWFKKPKGRPKKEKKIKCCLYCKKEFEARKSGSNKESNYCSHKCFYADRRLVDRPPTEQLLKEIEESNYCAVGRKYGVSDNAIRKWLKIK